MGGRAISPLFLIGSLFNTFAIFGFCDFYLEDIPYIVYSSHHNVPYIVCR